ncbi:MAG: hypothetical protein ABI199_09830 [Bacteroidia bacterium]
MSFFEICQRKSYPKSSSKESTFLVTLVSLEKGGDEALLFSCHVVYDDESNDYFACSVVYLKVSINYFGVRDNYFTIT